MVFEVGWKHSMCVCGRVMEVEAADLMWRAVVVRYPEDTLYTVFARCPQDWSPQRCATYLHGV